MRKPSLTSSPPQIVHPPHLYTNTAATVIHGHHYPGQAVGQVQQAPTGVPVNNGNHTGPPILPASETATYVNINTRPAFPPNYNNHQHAHHRPPPIHPGSGGHVPYSPAFHHHQHVRPVGIAMPRQGEAFQRQSSVGKFQIILSFEIGSKIYKFLLICRADWYWNHSASISKTFGN